MRGIGLDPARIPEAKRDDIDTFIELHIEQGPILEQAGLPVGIVTGITGYCHYVVDLRGTSNHAGAVPMDLRRDPMAGAAEIISGVINTAQRMGRPAVTTVGRIHAEPNYPAIRAGAGRVHDRRASPGRHPARAPLPASRRADPGGGRPPGPRTDAGGCWSTTRRGPSDPGVVDLLERQRPTWGSAPCRCYPRRAATTPSTWRKLAKTAMIFVQSKMGRSHTPEEYTAPEHLAAGLHLLTAALHRLAY